VGNNGAVAGLFYYRNDNNESDIEILTRDESSSIRYSNQPVVDDGKHQSCISNNTMLTHPSRWQ
jgi:hypothetical protein